MTDPTPAELYPPIPDPTPLPDAPGDQQTGDDLTELTPDDTPPLADGDGGPEVDPIRPDPCTAEGGE